MREVAEIKAQIAKASAARDKQLGFAAGKNTIATPYKMAKRIKDDELLKKNQREPAWPGRRNHFEIDRDQIMFHPDFIRLARKTQVFIGQRDVLYKNRLMHSLEVTQFSRGIGRKWNLNPDLVEAIAYGHDIGHAPFGHAGEEALNECLYEYHIRLLLRTIKGRARDFDILPTKGILGDQENDGFARRDRALWTLVESGVSRYPGNYWNHPLLLKTEVQEFVGQKLFDDLIKTKIMTNDGVDATECYIASPLKWKWDDDDQPERVQQEFWLQEEHRDFFAHNVHALRILIGDQVRPQKDVTYQTAYGILSHTGRTFKQFTCRLPDNRKVVLQHKTHSSPEAFLVQQSDDVCFTNSDLEDATRSKLLDWDLLDTEKMEAIRALAEEKPSGEDGFPDNSHRLQFCESGFEFRSRTDYDYDQHDLKTRIRKVRKIIAEFVYPALVPRQQSAKKIIRDLFWFHCEKGQKGQKEQKGQKGQKGHVSRRDIEKLAWKKRERFKEERKLKDEKASGGRVAADFIANMTDDEAMTVHRALFSPDQARWARHFMDVKDS